MSQTWHHLQRPRQRRSIHLHRLQRLRWSDYYNLCRVCNSQPETLPHIICHCDSNMVLIRERHKIIVERIRKAIRYGSVRIDQQIPGLQDECRPDIVISKDKEVTIIDVTCPFDNGEDALSTADLNKVNKYNHLKTFFHQQGIKCNMFGFVIGALGSWHPNNEAVLNQLQMSHSYKSLFRKLCCSDVIRGSAEVYYHHMDNQNLD